MHPTLCTFISEAIYDGRLEAQPSTANRHLVLRPAEDTALRPAGLSFVPVAHDGCTQSSRAEANDLRRLNLFAYAEAVAPRER
jgi:uncharacterized protein